MRRRASCLKQRSVWLRSQARWIVRRYLEGQNFRGIGEALGIREDAAQRRTSRAFERLNQFFKRKAGVTVSAAALAAGISRHCVEAAPAACLNIAGKAASTGLTSVLATASLTTMSIGKVTAAAAGLVVIGGTIALLATQDDTSPETTSTPPPALKQAHRSRRSRAANRLPLA